MSCPGYLSEPVGRCVQRNKNRLFFFLFERHKYTKSVYRTIGISTLLLLLCCTLRLEELMISAHCWSSRARWENQGDGQDKRKRSHNIRVHFKFFPIFFVLLSKRRSTLEANFENVAQNSPCAAVLRLVSFVFHPPRVAPAYKRNVATNDPVFFLLFFAMDPEYSPMVGKSNNISQ